MSQQIDPCGGTPPSHLPSLAPPQYFARVRALTLALALAIAVVVKTPKVAQCSERGSVVAGTLELSDQDRRR